MYGICGKYKNLGDMTEPSEEEFESNDVYFIPHHPVVKASSLRTRSREIFNESCPTSSRLSLNDVQYERPSLQNDIFDIFTRFKNLRTCETNEKLKLN